LCPSKLYCIFLNYNFTYETDLPPKAFNSVLSTADMNQDLSPLVASLLSNVSSKDLTTDQSLNIVVENCGDDQYKIKDRVRESRSLALKALVDSVRGTKSHYGFGTMFKSDSAKSAIEAILAGIYLYQVKPGLEPGTNIPKAPRISCVSPDSAQMYKNLDLGYDPWQRCLGGFPERTSIPAFYADETAYLFLCPALFALQETINKSHCPTVEDNKFAGDPEVFYKKYQTYTLIYHFLRFYLGDNALDRYSDPPEQLDWNDCVRLGSETFLDSIRNPTSLQLYIACKRSLTYGCEFMY